MDQAIVALAVYRVLLDHPFDEVRAILAPLIANATVTPLNQALVEMLDPDLAELAPEVAAQIVIDEKLEQIRGGHA